jgi:hypothetical protein
VSVRFVLLLGGTVQLPCFFIGCSVESALTLVLCGVCCEARRPTVNSSVGRDESCQAYSLELNHPVTYLILLIILLCSFVRVFSAALVEVDCGLVAHVIGTAVLRIASSVGEESVTTCSLHRLQCRSLTSF